MLRTSKEPFVLVQNLRTGSNVISASGTHLRVKNIRRHANACIDLVELHAGEARLIVTASHRVIVPGETGQQEVLAGSLFLGQNVGLNTGVKELTQVMSQAKNVDIFEVTFHPDEAVEAWQLPEAAILTKGQLPVLAIQDSAIDRWDAREFSTFVLLKVTRHPPSLANALMQKANLLATSEALTQAGFPHRLQSGARVFVPANRYEAALCAVQTRNLVASHILCSATLLPQVQAVIETCCHKDNVRVKEMERIDYAVPSVDLIVCRTFLDLPLQTRSVKSVVNSTTVAHAGQNPRCRRLV